MDTVITKFGAETTLEIDPVTGDGEGVHEEIFAGKTVRKLHFKNDSIKIGEEKEIVEKVFDLYKKMRDGKILGFTVDASKYNPQTLKVGRIVVTSFTFADK